MESFLTHPTSHYSNRQQENPLSGRPSDPPLRRVSIPLKEFKILVTEIRFTPERLWSAKSVSKLTHKPPEPHIIHQPQHHKYRKHIRAARTHERQRNSCHRHAPYHHSHIHQHMEQQ